MTRPDFSEYLSLPNKLETEESNWLANPHLHKRQAAAVCLTCKEFGLKSIIEIGSSTGNLVGYLDKYLDYTGLEKNIKAIQIAREKNPGELFVLSDIREFEEYNVDLVCCFAFLKHFGLHEWDNIFQKCASFGQYFIFDMQIAEETHDDGTEFHHVWKSIDGLNKSIYDAGLTLIKTIDGDPVAPIFVCRRKDAQPQKKKK